MKDQKHKSESVKPVNVDGRDHTYIEEEGIWVTMSCAACMTSSKFRTDTGKTDKERGIQDFQKFHLGHLEEEF